MPHVMFVKKETHSSMTDAPSFGAPVEKKPKKHSKAWIVLGVIVFCVLTFSYYAYHGHRVLTSIGEAKAQVMQAQTYLQAKDLELARRPLQKAQTEFQVAATSLDRFGFVSVLPFWRAEYAFASNVLDVGVLATEIANETFTDIEFLFDANDLSYQQLSIEQKETLLHSLEEAHPKLVTLFAKMDHALQAGHQLDINSIPDAFQDDVHFVMTSLEEAHGLLQVALPFVEVAPQLAGFDEEKTYLLLLQNHHELRATGGFIGTYGIINVHQGELIDFYTDNIYNLDEPAKQRGLRVEPPWQLTKYMGVRDWLMRDSNWSPDGPSAAEQVIWFYEQEQPGVKVDGLIAITPHVIEQLLMTLGEVHVKGQTYTAENLVEILQFKVEKEYYIQGISEADRKDIINDIAQVLKERLLNLNAAQAKDVLSVVQESFSQKHLWAYSIDNRVQQLLSDQDWDAAMHQTNGDFLMVVDNNLAALKTDAVLERAISYEVNETEQGRVATVSITYDNQGTFTWKTTRYRTYTRVYVPMGSKLLLSSGAMDMDRSAKEGEIEVIENEHGKTRFGAFIAIEPGKTGTLSFTYLLPDVINEEDYALYIQKQPGTQGHDLTVKIDVDKKVKSGMPSEDEAKWGDNIYELHTDLSLDRDISVVF